MDTILGQYRTVDLVLLKDQTAIPLLDSAGRLVVKVAPDSPTDFGRTVYRTAGPTFYETEANVAAVPRVLEALYVQLDGTLTNAVPIYIMVVDKAGAVVAGDGSVVPMSRLDAAGDLAFWEPPGGWKFDNGIRIIASSTPNVYTAFPMTAESISVTARTRDV